MKNKTKLRHQWRKMSVLAFAQQCAKCALFRRRDMNNNWYYDFRNSDSISKSYCPYLEIESSNTEIKSLIKRIKQLTSDGQLRFIKALNKVVDLDEWVKRGDLER